MNSRSFLVRTILTVSLFLIINSSLLMAEHPVVSALSQRFGQILEKAGDEASEFTVSASFEDVISILQTSEGLGWYVSHVTVNARDDGKVALIFKAQTKNRKAGNKFEKLQRLLQPGVFSWKSGNVPSDSTVITALETDFSDKIAIKGATKSSSLIFAQLFPLIERIQELRNPFFSRGTYSDTPDGRIMAFQIDCGW